MSSDGLIIGAGIVLSLMATAVSLKLVAPSSFWDLPFLIVFALCFVVFVVWFGVYKELVNIVKR